MIRFACPACGNAYNVGDDKAGRTGRCKCGEPIQIPAPRKRTPETPARRSPLPGILAVALVLFAVVMVGWYAVEILGWHETGLFFLCALALVGWVGLPIYICERMGRTRSIGATAGFFLGFLLGWLGVLIVLLYPDHGRQQKCPRCAEKIKAEAFVCRFCGHKLVG